MESAAEGIDRKVQETLVSIYDVSLKIKSELNIINEFLRELRTEVADGNENLTAVAEKMGLDMEQLTSKSKDFSLLGIPNSDYFVQQIKSIVKD